MDRRTFLTVSAAAGAELAFARPASDIKLRISPLTLDIGRSTGMARRLRRQWMARSRKAPFRFRRTATGSTAFTPGPVGTRWCHTHTMAHGDLSRAGFSGQYGFASILHGTRATTIRKSASPSIIGTGARHHGASRQRLGDYVQSGDIQRENAGLGRTARVKEGQRVLFRLLNASATDEVRIALPGHRFHVIAMDGNAVPRPQDVDFVYLDIGERVDAIVEMKTPGIWVFGSLKQDERAMGMGVVVEYSGKSGQPVWQQPAVDFVADPGSTLFHCHMQLHMDFGFMQLLEM